MMKGLKKSLYRFAMTGFVLMSGAAVSEEAVALEGLRDDQMREIVQERDRTQNRVNTRLQEQLNGQGKGETGAAQKRHQHRYTERVREQAPSLRSGAQGFGAGGSGSKAAGSARGGGGR